MKLQFEYHYESGDIAPYPVEPDDDLGNLIRTAFARQDRKDKLVKIVIRPEEAQKYLDETYPPEVEHRPGVGVEPCKYCNMIACDYDCDESQADGFDYDAMQDPANHLLGIAPDR